MRNPHATYDRFLATADALRRSVMTYTPEEFSRKPADDAWSIGQLYEHLVSGTRYLHLRNIDRCLSGDGVAARGSKTLPGKIVFLLGSFPPRRIKVPPSPEYTPVQPESTEAMSASLEALVEEMKAVADRISSTRATGKTRHPALGMLSADEWYRLVEMHFRHHLHQKSRLDAFLGVTGATRREPTPMVSES